MYAKMMIDRKNEKGSTKQEKELAKKLAEEFRPLISQEEDISETEEEFIEEATEEEKRQ